MPDKFVELAKSSVIDFEKYLGALGIFAENRLAFIYRQLYNAVKNQKINLEV